MEAVDVLLWPVVSEKSNDLANPVPGHATNAKNSDPLNKYVFRVRRDANKIQVRKPLKRASTCMLLRSTRFECRQRRRAQALFAPTRSVAGTSRLGRRRW